MLVKVKLAELHDSENVVHLGVFLLQLSFCGEEIFEDTVHFQVPDQNLIVPSGNPTARP